MITSHRETKTNRGANALFTAPSQSYRQENTMSTYTSINLAESLPTF
ncbi:MAG: hypothetical protein V7742_14345 [Halioglobus sp.]